MKLLNQAGKANLHTHTCYCDGLDRPLDMVLTAIDKGFSVLGFSGHEYSVYDEDFCMSKEATLRYREEVLALKEQYKGQLDIYLGIERDYYGEGSDYPYDYVIGSVHSLLLQGESLSIDNTEEIMEAGVKKYFDGDYRSFVTCYYETLADVVSRTKADIVGHFDLVCKFNEGNRYFDEEADWYKEAALTALESISKTNAIIEINTGAMAKGYRSRPYPAKFLLDEIEKLDLPVILSSDCHNRKYLDYGFQEIIGTFE